MIASLTLHKLDYSWSNSITVIKAAAVFVIAKEVPMRADQLDSGSIGRGVIRDFRDLPRDALMYTDLWSQFAITMALKVFCWTCLHL